MDISLTEPMSTPSWKDLHHMLAFRVVHKYKSEIYIQFRPPNIRLSMEGFGLSNPIQDRLKRCQNFQCKFPIYLARCFSTKLKWNCKWNSSLVRNWPMNLEKHCAVGIPQQVKGSLLGGHTVSTILHSSWALQLSLCK